MDVEPRLRQEALAVLLIVEARDVHEGRRLPVLLLRLRLGGLLGRSRAGKVPRLRWIGRAIAEGDLGAVRRPGKPGDPTFQVGKALRLTSLEGELVDLLLLVASVGDERDRSAIRAPCGASVLVLAEREPARLASLHRNDPEVRLVSILLRIDGPDLIDGAASIGGDCDGVDELKLEQILRRHLLSLRHACLPLYLIPLLNRLIWSFRYESSGERASACVSTSIAFAALPLR